MLSLAIAATFVAPFSANLPAQGSSGVTILLDSDNEFGSVSGTLPNGDQQTITIDAANGSDLSSVDAVVVGGTRVVGSDLTPQTSNVVFNLPPADGAAAGSVDLYVEVAGVRSNIVQFSYSPRFNDLAADQKSASGQVVVLGDLASRSNRGELTFADASGGRYNVFGTDSLTNAPYSFSTDFDYEDDNTHTAWEYESDERALTGAGTFNYSDSSDIAKGLVTYLDEDAIQLDSYGQCLTSNVTTGGFTTYCSAFGPEIYSEVFYAEEGQSLTFDWAAKVGGDHFEVYAFLVKRESLTDTTSAPTTSNSFLVLHSRGATQAWTPQSGPIPLSSEGGGDGFYQFRFVNGTYDKTGLWGIGAEMYLKPKIIVGLTNQISLGPLGDQVASSVPATISVPVSASSGEDVTISLSGGCVFSDTTSGPKEISGTFDLSLTSNSDSTCTLTANQGRKGLYAPAQTVTSSFVTRSAASTPSAPTLTGLTAANAKLNGTFAAPVRNGGAVVSDYEYSFDGTSWRSLGTTSSPFQITTLTDGTTPLTNGTEYTVRIRAINSSGEGTVSNLRSATPATTVPTAPSILSVAAGDANLVVAFGAPTDDGGSSIINYEYSTDGGSNWTTPNPRITVSPLTISGLTNGTAYQVRVRAVNGDGFGAQSTAVSGTPSVPITPAPPAETPSTEAVAPEAVVTPPLVNPRPIPRSPLTPAIQAGPVLRGNVAPAPPSVPTATIGGRSTPIQTQVTSPTGFSLTAGVLNLGLQVQQDQGVVRQNNTGGTEVEVRKGSTTALSGSGLLPRSTVQVFLPLQGSNSKELARIPVDDTGSFSGDAVFATRTNERPLPIGRQVLQVVSLDETGQQSVVEMTVNIAQSAPAPEPDRTAGATPTLRPGQSLATNAGEPEIVTVVPLPEDKSAVVEGDGWQMAVNVAGENGGVTPSSEGGAVLELVRDETAVVSGSGFMPFTRADVWLFSEPTLLGTVDIDANGEFNGEVNVDGTVVAVGEHTLQLQGVGEDGYVRAANLGVVVNDVGAPVTTEDAAGGFLWWLVALIAAIGVAAAVTSWQVRRRLR